MIVNKLKTHSDANSVLCVFNMFLEEMYLKKIRLKLCSWVFLYSIRDESGADEQLRFEKVCSCLKSAVNRPQDRCLDKVDPSSCRQIEPCMSFFSSYGQVSGCNMCH